MKNTHCCEAHLGMYIYILFKNCMMGVICEDFFLFKKKLEYLIMRFGFAYYQSPTSLNQVINS